MAALPVTPSAFNTLAAAPIHGEFSGEHLGLLLDGERLDHLLDRLVPGLSLRELIPTLLGWGEFEAENEVARRRFLPPAGTTANAPLLFCPDDLDFSCTVVIAEVAAETDAIVWRRVGLDRSAWSPDAEHVGGEVEWFDGVGPFRFAREEYARVLEAFADAEGG